MAEKPHNPDPIDHEAEARRGEEAKRVLNSPLVVEVLADMEKKIFTGIRECPLRDEEGLKNLRLMLKVVDDFKQNLQTIVDTGRMAEIVIRQNEKVELE